MDPVAGGSGGGTWGSGSDQACGGQTKTQSIGRGGVLSAGLARCMGLVTMAQGDWLCVCAHVVGCMGV